MGMPGLSQGGAYRFSHLVGTIFENTKLDLLDWFRVIHLMLTSKKGVAARQVHRDMGFGPTKPPITCAIASARRFQTRISEADRHRRDGRNYFGGKPRKGQPTLFGRATKKTPIIGAVTRKGNVVAGVINNIQLSKISKALCTKSCPIR